MGWTVYDSNGNIKTNALGSPVPVANGGTGTSTQFTQGSIVFAGASGVYSQDNVNLFWDSTNKRVGMGTAAPNNPLEVVGGPDVIRMTRTGVGEIRLGVSQLSTPTVTAVTAKADGNSIFGWSTSYAYFNSNALEISSSQTSQLERLAVTGGARVGLSPTSLTTVTDNPLTSGATTVNVASTTNYPPVGTLLIDSEAMTYTNTTATSFTGVTRGALGTTAASHAMNATVTNFLFIARSNDTNPRVVITAPGRVGIGVTNPQTTVDIAGTLQSTGTITTTGGTADINAGRNISGQNLKAGFNGNIYWDTRGLMSSPADSQVNVTNNAATVGVGFDVSTDGTLKVRTRAQSADAQISGASVRGNAVTFANVPTTPVEGMLVAVTDSTTNVWGATITGGGANHVLGYYNGTNWTVAAK